MGCNTKTKKKIMDSVRKKHPNYSLKRRKKIVSAIVYGKRR